MARELAIKIVVDNTEAQGKLAQTDTSLNRLGGTAAKVVVPAFDDVGAALQRTLPPLDTMMVTSEEVDAALLEIDASTITLRKGLNGLAEGLGITVDQLGAVGTAAAVAAAAFIGWKIGRFIADMLDLDDAIGNVTASLTGMGDVAAETAAAKQDVLARASANAGREITNYKDAININTEAQKVWAKQAIELNATLERQQGPKMAQAQLSSYSNEIAKVVAAGTVRQLSQELTSHSVSLQDLSQWYHVSVGALQQFTAELKVQQQAWDEWYKHAFDAVKNEAAAAAEANRVTVGFINSTFQAQKQSLAESGKLWDEYYALRVEHGDGAFRAQMAQIQQWAKNESEKLDQTNVDWANHYQAIQAVAAERLRDIAVDWDVLYKHSRQSLEDTATQARATYEEMAAHSENFSRTAIDHFQMVAEKAEAAARDWRNGFDDAFDETIAKTGTMNAGVDGLTQSFQALHDVLSVIPPDLDSVFDALGIAHDLFGRPVAGGPFHPQGKAAGGPVMAGHSYMVGERGPELFTPSGSGRITPNGGGGLSINIVINGDVDSESRARRLADQVAARIMARTNQHRSATLGKA